MKIENRKFPRGFTLIELLVVIAIISLLVSILLPSLNRAKELAKGVICASNMRNCGLATLLYTEDHGGKILEYTWNGTEEVVWHEALVDGDYLESGEILLCPSHAPEAYNSPYHTMGGRRSLDTPLHCLIRTTEAPNHTWTYLDLYAVKYPSDYLHLADAVFKPSSSHYPNQSYGFSFACVYSAGIHMRHSGQVNAWFVEGHVETCSEARLTQAILTEMPSDTEIVLIEEDGD